MSHAANNSYLETQILTATPQKLRLMLIEGALRHGRLALSCWAEQKNELAYDALVRCRDIVAELLGAARPIGSPLERQVAAIYLFLFRTLAEAQLERSTAKVESVLRVLEVEQETWRQLCEQMPEAPVAEAAGPRPSSDVSAYGLGAIPPIPEPRMHGHARHATPVGSQFSLEG